jgi:hypothetical protein
VVVFGDGYSKRGEVDSQCDFDLHLLYGRDVEHFFMCFLAMGFFEKTLFSSVAHFFIGSLILERGTGVLHVFWNNSFKKKRKKLRNSPKSIKR